MIGKFVVVDEQYRRWDQQNGKVGEAYELTLLDVTTPPRHALNHKVRYTMTEDEQKAHWKKLLDKTVSLAVTDMFAGKGSPLPTVRGQILEVGK